MTTILLYAALLAGAAVVACIVYFVVYQSVINRRLREGQRQGRRLPAPGMFAVGTVVFILLLFGGGSLLIRLSQPEPPSLGASALIPTYDFNVYGPEDMTGYRAGYDLEQNPGYTRQVQTQGQVRLTTFTTTQPYDAFHPTYILFAEYLGDAATYDFHGAFLDLEGKELCSKGAGGADVSGPACVLVATSANSPFALTLDYYGETGEKVDGVTFYIGG